MVEKILNREFLAALKPFICGTSVYKSNFPFCEEDSPDLNLGDYLSSGYLESLLPFKTPLPVQFCTEYKRIFEDSNKFCLPIAADTQTKLAAIINGQDSEPIKVPGVSEIYQMLTVQNENATPEQLRRMKEHIRKKAQKIHKDLDELNELKEEKKKRQQEDALQSISPSDNGNGDDPINSAIDEKKNDITDESRQVCVVDNPDDLSQLFRDCADVLARHEWAKSALKWGAGVLATAGAALWAFIKSGRASESWKAAIQTWKKTARTDLKIYSPRRWFSLVSPLRWLKTIDAFVRAKPIGADGTGETSGNTNKAADAKPADLKPEPDFDSPSTSPKIIIDNSAVAIKASVDVQMVVANIKDTLSLLLDLADDEKGVEQDLLSTISAEIESTSENASDDLKRLGPLLAARGTIKTHGLLVSRLEEAVIFELLPTLGAAIAAADAKIEGGDEHGAVMAFKDIEKEMGGLGDIFKDIETLDEKLRSCLSSIDTMLEIPGKKDVSDIMFYTKGTIQSINESRLTIRGWLNDFDTIEPREVVEEMRKGIELSNVGSMMQSVKWIMSHKAARRQVNMTVNAPSKPVIIPAELRAEILLLLLEIADNALDKSDTHKSRTERKLDMNVSIKKNILTLTSVDTGVGIDQSELERILETANGNSSLKMRVIDPCKKYGWKPVFETEAGKGMKATITMDISSWSGSSITGPQSPNPSSAPDSGAPSSVQTTTPGTSGAKMALAKKRPTVGDMFGRFTSGMSNRLGIARASASMAAAGSQAFQMTNLMHGGILPMMGALRMVGLR